MKLLHLNLKGEYFDAIEDGSKDKEYRLYNEYWQRRLFWKVYDGIVIKRGYPKRDDMSRTLERPWHGWEIETITHPHFGNEPVKVFAIKVNSTPRV